MSNLRKQLEEYLDNGAYHHRVTTGKKFPADVHSRQYDLVVKGVSDDVVTFEVASRDWNPVSYGYANFLGHGLVHLGYDCTIEELLGVAAREADPAFFEKYPCVDFHEAAAHQRAYGLELSTEEGD